MATLDDLDDGFFKQDWRQAGKSNAPKSFEDLDKQFDRQIKSANMTYPKTETDEVKPVDLDMFDKSTLQLGPLDTKIPIPASVARGLAQIGSGMADVPLAGRQIVNRASKEDVEEKRRLDAPLNKGVVGTINNLGGKALPFAAAPYGFIPKAAGAAAPIIEGGLMSAIQGFLEPVGKGESRAQNTALSGAAGTIIPGGTAIAQKLAAPKAAANPLVQSAIREGIPLGIADTTSNKLIKAFKSIGDDVGLNNATKDAQQEAFNRAFGKRWGSTASKHTPDVRAADKQRIGKALEDVWGRNDLPYDSNLFGTLRQMEAEADKYPGQVKDTILAHINDLEKKVVQKPNGDLYIPGPTAFQFQSDLFKNFKGGQGALDNEMMKLRGSILDNFNANVSGEDAAINNLAREQYRAFKTGEGAITKSDNMMAGRVPGDVSPADASSAITKNYPNAVDTPFGDLPQIGQSFLRDTTDRRGGSIRAALQNAGVGNSLLLGLGTGAGYMAGLPAAAATTGGLWGANKLLASPAVREALMNDVPEAMLKNPNGIMALMNRATKEGGKNTLRQLPATGALGALGSFRPTTSDDTEGRERAPLESTDEEFGR